MNIPDDLRRTANVVLLRHGSRESFEIIAEWARKETLQQAVELLAGLNCSPRDGEGVGLAITALHALAERADG